MNDGITILLAFVAGFVIAQVAKLIGALIKNKGKMSFSEVIYWLFRSGGMPSGHSASFIAAATACGWIRGFTSVECVILICMSVIIIYDAVNVRYAVGEHGKLLNEIAISDNNAKTKPQKLVEGHTIPQAVVGILIGLVVGTLMYYLYGIISVA